MPKGVRTGEEIVGETNTEAVLFRAPKRMKANMDLACDFGNYPSKGELMRNLFRRHWEETTNSQAFKFWLKRKEEDPEFRLEQAKKTLKELNYEVELRKVDQKQLVQLA